ncbi:PREDICTED: serine/threonine-protein phosphatase 6 regulatory subunit 3-like isoform X2 [Priapulus caudatus]|uniref:Serine/threonine-protein phosphatase 6 regulatory subunit 3-like isoform X2 n=1 Tax=Priapulus caudatus TaxID=37621 RepID=A0ABM1DYN5_PRICU|nr:PREDICTED: serine/threonine-protein phosphatase 6 regulatory subunit 3-like isoform X2 [Priapulus caudatus]
MFWKCNMVATSNVDTLLDDEDVTLHKLMEEEDLLQECKGLNNKLIVFLVQPEVLHELVDLIITEPPEGEVETMRYKYANLACELLTCDVSKMNEVLSSSIDVLDKLCTFIRQQSPLNPLLASFFSKTLGILVLRKSETMLKYISGRENMIDEVLQHLDKSANMDLVLRFATCAEPHNIRCLYKEWLNEQKLVPKLVSLIEPKSSEQMQCYASQAVCDMVISLRDQKTHSDKDSTDTFPLLSVLESESTASQLLDQMFSGSITELTLVHGISVFLAIFDTSKPNSADVEQEAALQEKFESTVADITGAVEALIPRLHNLHNVLEEPPALMPMITTIGTLDPPFGSARLQVAKLVSAIIEINEPRIDAELARLGTLDVLLDLFFKYEWNNFLHTHVEHSIRSVFAAPPLEGDTVLGHPLIQHLFSGCRLKQRILESFEKCDSGCRRPGYMGHVIKIANDIASFLEAESSEELVKSFETGTLADSVQKWQEFVAGPLTDINKKQAPDIITGPMLHTSLDGDFSNADFPHETAFQQAFERHRLQQMTDNFLASAPLDGRLNKIKLVRSDAVDMQGDAALFEKISSQKSRSFGDGSDDDDDDDDDDDGWEFKDGSGNVFLSAAAETERSVDKLPLEQEPEGSGSSSEEEENSGPRKIVSASPVAKGDLIGPAATNDQGWANFDLAPASSFGTVSDDPNLWDTAQNPAPDVFTSDAWDIDSEPAPWKFEAGDEDSTEGWADFSGFSSTIPCANLTSTETTSDETSASSTTDAAPAAVVDSSSSSENSAG